MLLGKPCRNQRPVGLHKDWLLSFRIRRRDSCPAAPIRRTSHARKSTDPDTESIGRWIDRSRVVSPSTEAFIVLEENKRHCVCLHSISLGHAGPRGYLIWDDVWGSCRRLAPRRRTGLRKARQILLGESWYSRVVVARA